jgi:hypothetical protein
MIGKYPHRLLPKIQVIKIKSNHRFRQAFSICYGSDLYHSKGDKDDIRLFLCLI